MEIRILSGALAGTVTRFEDAPLSVGRGPEAGLRFHASEDLTVSARHALLYPEGGVWWLRDLDSLNGTFLNGCRVSGTVAISDGDRITFGFGGPEVRLSLARGRTSAGGEPGAGVRGRAPLLWGRLAAAVIAGLLTVIVILVAAGQRTRSAFERERAALLARLDSVLLAGDLAVRALEGEREELGEALRSAQEVLRATRTELERAVAAGDDERIDELRREVQSQTAALQRQQLAASLNFDDIEAGSRRAVALVYVETEAGLVSSATAFAVRPDGTLLTARHLVQAQEGEGVQARRIGVQFTDSDQVFPAELLAVDSVVDLAVLRARNILGDVPVVRGFNPRGDTLPAGSPVVVMGFPLGGGAGSVTGTNRIPRPLVSSGVIVRWEDGLVEIQGYGAAGASGSPIFDAEGRVVALLFGGADGADGHRVFAVPAADALRLLERVRGEG